MKKDENISLGAEEILTGEEYQGIIALVVIFMVGFFSILASVWWVKVVGWVVLALTGLSAYRVGKGIEKRVKEAKE